MAFDNPTQELDHLDSLWFQIAGTLCNLRCKHCFISCSPENQTLGMMTFDHFLPHLQDAVQLGVKEFYFTGGEPFANPDLLKILEATLQVGRATLLTNATLFSRQVVTPLVSMRDASIYSLLVNQLYAGGQDPPSVEELLNPNLGLDAAFYPPVILFDQRCSSTDSFESGRHRPYDETRAINTAYQTEIHKDQSDLFPPGCQRIYRNSQRALSFRVLQRVNQCDTYAL
jgi:hypothetical protein